MDRLSTSGLDLAKSVFQFHAVDEDGNVLSKRQLRRAEVLRFYAKLPPHVVAMEACGTAHHWAREIARLGHRVKLLPPKYVKAYVRRGKTDAADAEAICEAASRPVMREVPVKSLAQQSLLMQHRCRDLLVRQRTQTINALRAHLAELGVISATGSEGVKALVGVVGNRDDHRIPAMARVALEALVAMLDGIEMQIATIDRAIQAAHAASETSLRLATLPGIGPLAATAFVGTVADAGVFKSGRSFAAWLGVTPRLDGTGGKVTLGPITKQGDRYLRRLLVMGATAMLGHARRRPDRYPQLAAMLARATSFKTAAVALANKMARIIWALMVRGGTYCADHRPLLPAARKTGLAVQECVMPAA